MRAQLSLHHVTKMYQQHERMVDILDTVSVDFIQGQSYAIIGASGSGKSTIMHMLAGIDTPTSGSIVFFDGVQDRLVHQFSPQAGVQFFQHTISLVLQQACLLPELTIIENVMLKGIIQGTITAQSYDHARNLLSEVGLLDKADAYPAMLSGGQQQRVAILRAIFIVPQFLLVDEPTGNLDPESADQVIDLLLVYHKKYTMGLIMSTHNHMIARRMGTLLKLEHKKLHNNV